VNDSFHFINFSQDRKLRHDAIFSNPFRTPPRLVLAFFRFSNRVLQYLYYPMTPTPHSSGSCPCAQYTIVSAGDGSPTIRDTKLEETFHPELGMDQEIKLLLDQPEVAQVSLAPGKPWIIWDLGLGAGGMAAGILRHGPWSQDPIHLHSFDVRWDAFDLSCSLPTPLPHLTGLPTSGLRHNGSVEWLENQSLRRWTMHLGDLPTLMDGELPGSFPSPDLVMVDLHSPESQPELWTLSFWKNVHRRCGNKPCLLIFHTRSTSVRATLLLAGFFVGVGRSLGKKEETTLAATNPDLLSRPLPSSWLQTLARSTQGQPLIQPPYTRQPINPGYLEKISLHPQFHP
jgi:hypothetical protein